jgi:hypothetical protein
VILHEERRRRLKTWYATWPAKFMSQTIHTTASPDEANKSDL